jgi:hypothetical protein
MMVRGTCRKVCEAFVFHSVVKGLGKEYVRSGWIVRYFVSVSFGGCNRSFHLPKL